MKYKILVSLFSLAFSLNSFADIEKQDMQDFKINSSTISKNVCSDEDSKKFKESLNHEKNKVEMIIKEKNEFYEGCFIETYKLTVK